MAYLIVSITWEVLEAVTYCCLRSLKSPPIPPPPFLKLTTAAGEAAVEVTTPAVEMAPGDILVAKALSAVRLELIISMMMMIRVYYHYFWIFKNILSFDVFFFLLFLRRAFWWFLLIYIEAVLSYLLVTSAFTTWHTSSIQTMIGEAILVAILRFEVLQEVEVVGLVTRKKKRKRKLKLFFVFLCLKFFLTTSNQFDIFMHLYL